MSKTVELILKESMQLGPLERAHLVDELLATLETENDDEVDVAWAAEVEKRSAELAAGKVRPVMWSALRQRARKGIHDKSKN